MLRVTFYKEGDGHNCIDLNKQAKVIANLNKELKRKKRTFNPPKIGGTEAEARSRCRERIYAWCKANPEKAARLEALHFDEEDGNGTYRP